MSAGSDLATFGRGYAIFTAITGSIIGIIFIVFGFLILKQSDDFSRKNPKQPKPSKTPGYVLIGFGVVIIIITWVIVVLTQKSKGFAQAEGIFGGAALADDLITGFQ